jgi:pyruvate/2-oxoacid:ferredoxin oxidoreductase alpha subunit
MLQSNVMNTLTAKDEALQILNERGVGVLETTLQDLHTHEPKLFQHMQQKQPLVVIVGADSVQSLDVMALRWMFRGGVTPLVLCPGSASECAELAWVAASAAELIGVPVFLLLEPGIGEEPSDPEERTDPNVSWDAPPPPDEVLPATEQEAADFLEIERRVQTPLQGFHTGRLVPCPPEQGRPEWLVVSYGASGKVAHQAADAAANEGMRINRLNLRQLWPVPEEMLMKAAMGVRHVVVAERNLGQYAQEIRRVLPELPVIPAGGPGKGLSPESVLLRLQRAPRCC